ncbi:hypothetical protein A9R01_15540 ['Osedax' symbiont bacterium Rs2_46_30_T18]|nr:hypothetical protein A9R01_15540 ['Osedax' symbiont bacterium Rs2_46_30_T18]
MTLLALAYNGYKILDKFLFASNNYQAVEHLSDGLLNDVGLHREGGKVFNLNATVTSTRKVKSEKDTADSVILIPGCLEDSGG